MFYFLKIGYAYFHNFSNWSKIYFAYVYLLMISIKQKKILQELVYNFELITFRRKTR